MYFMWFSFYSGPRDFRRFYSFHDFDFSPHERAVREPRSSEHASLREIKKSQEKPL